MFAFACLSGLGSIGCARFGGGRDFAGRRHDGAGLKIKGPQAFGRALRPQTCCPLARGMHSRTLTPRLTGHQRGRQERARGAPACHVWSVSRLTATCEARQLTQAELARLTNNRPRQKRSRLPNFMGGNNYAARYVFQVFLGQFQTGFDVVLHWSSRIGCLFDVARLVWNDRLLSRHDKLLVRVAGVRQHRTRTLAAAAGQRCDGHHKKTLGQSGKVSKTVNSSGAD